MVLLQKEGERKKKRKRGVPFFVISPARRARPLFLLSSLFFIKIGRCAAVPRLF